MSLRPCSSKLALALRSQTFPLRYPPFLQMRAASSGGDESNAISQALIKSIHASREGLRTALRRQSPDEVASALTTFRMTVLKTPEEKRGQILQEALRMDGIPLDKVVTTLSKTPDEWRSYMLELIFRESKKTFGVPQNAALLSTVLQALVDAGETTRAFRFLQKFDKRKSPVYPNGDHWRIVMKGYAQEGHLDFLDHCLQHMHERYPLPGNPHYQTLLEGMINAETVSPQDVEQVVEEMHRIHLPYDEHIQQTLTKLMSKDALVFTHLDYEKLFKDPKHLHRPTMSTIDAWIEELVNARKVARSSFEQKIRQLRYKGLVPGPTFYARLVRVLDVSTVEELRYLGVCLGVTADVRVWSVCMETLLRKQGWKAAVEAYDYAKTTGIKPDSRMLDRIIRDMLRVPLKQLTDDVIDRIVILMDDLGKRADLAIYNLVLHALTSSANEAKYYPIAVRILGNMKEQNIKMDVMASTAAARILIQSAGSFEEAKAAYEEVRNLSDPPLDLIGYRNVLRAFCRVENRVTTMDFAGDSGRTDYEGMQLSIPPASTYFEIVKDMRDRGYPISSHEYSILLSRYAMLATRAHSLEDPLKRVAILSAIRADIEETHRRISVDAGLDLDGVLMNRLMDAYNRADSVPDAMRMWKMLVTSGKVNSASISIVFDTCGHGRSIARADAVFQEIKTLGLTLNVWNWNAWIECLCRLYKTVEAANVARKEMPAHGISPNEETWRVLTSFGVKINDFKQSQSSAMASLAAFQRTAPRTVNKSPGYIS